MNSFTLKCVTFFSATLFSCSASAHAQLMPHVHEGIGLVVDNGWVSAGLLAMFALIGCVIKMKISKYALLKRTYLK